MNQKRTKGFTLIELLAVIVILAIIALIAVPVILNIIDKANIVAFKDSAYGIISAGELYFAEQQLELEGMKNDVTIELTDSRLELKGKVPSGTITITKDGDISISVSNGRYCATKGFEDKDVTITKGTCDGNSGNTKTLTIGDEVYFNPVVNEICDATKDYVSTNSTMGFKDGCMKWYIYKKDGNNIGLILDHNTTAASVWDKSNDDTTEQGTIALMTLLESDTVNWTVKADIIDAQDIFNLLPWYQKLEDKTTMESRYGEEVWEPYLAGLEETQKNILPSQYNTVDEYLDASIDYAEDNYPDLVLPKMFYRDLMYNSIMSQLTNTPMTTVGYWTKTTTERNNNMAYYMTSMGVLYAKSVANGEQVGVRPVITLTESKIGATVVLGGNTGGNTGNTLSSLATTSSEVTSIPACVNNGTNCTPGTEIAIKVNNTQVYDFYVIEDTGNEVTLIMDRNIGAEVAWMSDEDYGCGVTGDKCALNDKGPITALNYLNVQTSNWSNILPIESYTYNNNVYNDKLKGYQKLMITNGTGILTSYSGTMTTLSGTMRARLITKEEVEPFADPDTNLIPEWLYANLPLEPHAAYWFLSGFNDYDGDSATFLFCLENVGFWGLGTDIYVSDSRGVRPVITISK